VTNKDTHDIVAYDEEREWAVVGLADSLFSAEGSYASALYRLSGVLVDLKGTEFVRRATEQIVEEMATKTRETKTDPVAEASPIPRHTRFATADESYKMFDVTGHPHEILGDLGGES